VPQLLQQEGFPSAQQIRATEQCFVKAAQESLFTLSLAPTSAEPDNMHVNYAIL